MEDQEDQMEQLHRFIDEEDLVDDNVLSELSLPSTDWGQLTLGLPEAWKHTKGEDIIVAVLDTGCPNHVDINDNILFKYDVTGDGPEDNSGHSSNICGIIAAIEDGKGITGVAPKCKIITIKVLNNKGLGSFSNMAKGLDICRQINVDIINMSLGVNIEPPEEIHNLIKQLTAQGKIIIAAAGNNPKESVNYPAAYDEVIAVAPIDENLNVAEFATIGPKIAVATPGVDIYSLYLNNGYKMMSGSSQAAPFFSGICALILSYVRKHPNELPIKSYLDILKLLDILCDEKTNDHLSGRLKGCNFGIPNFSNYMPWKNDATI